MPTDRNPSHTLTQARLDMVIDKLTAGKNCKWPPSIEDVWATGMMPNSNGNHDHIIRDYVQARWMLTRTGTTMRTRKLAGRLEKYRSAAADHPNAVWKVAASHYSRTECFVTGKMSPVLRESTWLLWGWLFNDSSITSGDGLRFTAVGLGGTSEALRRNQSLVGALQDQVTRHREAEESAVRERMRLEGLLEQVQGMNSMMTAAAADEALK